MSTVVVLIAIAVLWGASVLVTNRHNSRAAIESTGGVVSLGKASKLLDHFEGHGDIPLYFPDVSGSGTRGVYLTHRGDRSDKGWTAFLAQVPGEASSCQWQWDPRAGRFDASCDRSQHADAAGIGLEQFPVEVAKGKLHLDLRADMTGPDPTGSGSSGTS